MSQSLTKMWIHLIFSTKDRYPFLKDFDVQKKLYGYIKKTCLENRCGIETIGGVEDHVHILLNINKNTSLAALVEIIKRSSSKWIKSISDDNTLLNQFYWQRGYGAFSVSESNIAQVKQYIKNQRTHHEKLTFQEELKRFLIAHGVAFNEKYLWD